MVRQARSHQGISRIDQPAKRTHGWYVRVRSQGRLVCKFFPDKRAGGKAEALAGALSYRDQLAGGPEGAAAPAGRSVRQGRASRSPGGAVSVQLESDVAAAFPDARAVNEALRQLLAVARRTLAESSWATAVGGRA